MQRCDKAAPREEAGCCIDVPRFGCVLNDESSGHLHTNMTGTLLL